MKILKLVKTVAKYGAYVSIIIDVIEYAVKKLEQKEKENQSSVVDTPDGGNN